MSEPLVSVIIPVYKHAGVVMSAVRSVLAQTYRNREVIVVNDGSPDDTAAAVRPAVEAGLVRYVEQPNQGQATARNRGLAETTGDLVAFLDADDEWPADKLAWQVAALAADPGAVLVYGRSRLLGREGEPVPPEQSPSGWVGRQFRVRCHIVSPGQTLIRRSALDRCGGFDATLWGVEDWDLWVRLAAVGRFAYADRVCLHYRIHADNCSRDGWRMFTNGQRMRAKHFGRVPRPWSAVASLRCRRFYEQYWPSVHRAAEAAAAAGDWADARRQWGRLFRVKPLYLARPAMLLAAARAFVPHRQPRAARPA